MRIYFGFIVAISCFFTSFYSQANIDLIVVTKSKNILELKQNGKTVKKYHVALSTRSKGHKLREGDKKTPEGHYTIITKNDRSSFYKALKISYPNSADILTAKAFNVNPGGQIMIHGQSPRMNIPASIMQKTNWTNGCIALTNNEMDELWDLVSIGTPIDILP